MTHLRPRTRESQDLPIIWQATYSDAFLRVHGHDGAENHAKQVNSSAFE
jgi:hypothetical protein